MPSKSSKPCNAMLDNNGDVIPLWAVPRTVSSNTPSVMILANKHRSFKTEKGNLPITSIK